MIPDIPNIPGIPGEIPELDLNFGLDLDLDLDLSKMIDYTLELSYYSYCCCCCCYYYSVVVAADTGRTVLLTWVCMLAVTYPLNNFRNNLHVMSNTLVCAEVKVINSTAKLVKMALAPINGQYCCINGLRTTLVAWRSGGPG